MEENNAIKNQLIEKYKFTSQDFAFIVSRGVALSNVLEQLQAFENGIPKIKLEKPALLNDGIFQFTNDEISSFVQTFEEKQNQITISKFVPASGAASRMFKFLLEFLEQYNPETESINAYINRLNALEISVFMVGLEKFPFYNLVLNKAKDIYANYESLSNDYKLYYFIKTLLDKNQFDFANKPKGILPFHKAGKTISTPVEKHLQEALVYKDKTESSKVHFTITPEFQNDFEAIVNRAGFEKMNVDYSYQSERTDTISVTKKNKVFRLENGDLFFRPGGHGALLENLNKIDSDLIFIRNIDNISYNHFQEIIQYKKALGGYLLYLQNQIFTFLKQLDSNADVDLKSIKEFCVNELNCSLSADFEKFSLEHQKSDLFALLNRPIRVCGMVKNEGEPGGGPFWVNDNGIISLQIVESSQIDVDNLQQKNIFASATHFNPVDIVCGVKNYRGEKFDLTQFTNPETGFIADKTKGSQSIKAYEHPGLWNGSMANWITIFVEVPLLTFSPVKTVDDLLKPAHQVS